MRAGDGGIVMIGLCPSVFAGTAQPSADAWSPVSSKLAGTTNGPLFAPLGSIDRSEPSRPPLAGSGAPKFDALPTKRRVESSIAPDRGEEMLGAVLDPFDRPLLSDC